MTLYVAKYTVWEQSNEGSSMSARKSHSKEHIPRIPEVVKRAQALILDDPGQSLRKLASIVGVSEPTLRGGSSKSYILKIDDLWGKPSCSPRLPFWPFPFSPDLNLLEYVWSTVKRVTNKSRHPNVTSLIKNCYWGSIRRHGQRYITACVRTLQI